MGTYRLYLDEPCEGTVGRGTEYHYEDGVLEINWYGERAWHHVPSRTAVVVKCRGELPEVLKLEPPYGYRQRLLWLCGLPREARANTMAEYDRLVKAEEIKGAQIRHEGGPGWQIAWGIRPGGKGKRGWRQWLVAGYAEAKIKDKEIRRMLEAAGSTAPDWYVKKVLSGRKDEL